VERLEALARATVEAVPVAPADVGALRERTARRRRRRRTRFSALTVAIALVGGVAVWRALAPDDARAPSIVGTPTRPPVKQAAPLLPGVPQPSEPADQARVGLDRGGAPMAVRGDAVWVASTSGVDRYDPETLQRIATVPTDVPVVNLAASSDGVWAVTGDDIAGDRGAGTPYTLLRIDPDSERIVFSEVLPFVDDGRRSSSHLRLVAGRGVAWVSFGTSLLRVDPASGQVTPISLQGQYAGNIAADRDGLWVANGGSTVLHVDGQTNEITTIDGIPSGFMWSIAATDDAAWLVEAYADGNREPVLHLVRIDAATHALTPFVVPGIAVVTGDDQIWVQLYKASSDGADDLHELVGQVDPMTGRIVRTMHIFLGGVPGSSGDGYPFPPFAVADGRLWSAYSGLQRTTIPSSTSTRTVPPIDLSTALAATNSYYQALSDHDADAARQAIALELRPRWSPSPQVINPDVTDLESLTRLHIETPQPTSPPEAMGTWPYSEWVRTSVTYRATYRRNAGTSNGAKTRFLYLARAAGTQDWYIAAIGTGP
jgi:hypothetical protein